MSSVPTLRDIPTCDLQRELSRREGVQAVFLGPDDKLTKTVQGPAWVTVNRD
ncbi:BC1881 family protein [Yoonia sp. R2-816]|uniref:BC1881 family protein n=1 Tax=Yoonia sp. R2-816 TaxID=3342638 RepID=UPI00372AB0C2